MAEVQLFKLEFLASNGGDAVAGDVLDIYVETDDIVTPAHPLSFESTGIYVKLNGTLLVGDIFGYSWLLMDSTEYTIHQFNQQICSSSSLISFTAYPALHPYVVYYSEENHYSCAVNPPTCDLNIIGIPSVVPATDTVTPDGSIEVTATSTNPIEYKIGSDFVYGDGTAQISNIFSGLLPGDYRVFVRDDKNCKTNVLVTVAVDNTYGTKFRLEYEDQNHWLTRVDITRRGYSGAVFELKGAPEPYIASLRGEGEIDKLLPLMAISAEVRLTSVTNAEFIEIFTNDPNLYRVQYSKDFGGGFEPKLLTRVIKNQYQEPYKASPNDVSFKSTDGLPELKEYFLIQGDGQKYFGNIKLVKLIAHCLSVLKLGLNINIGCNMYATGMDSTDSDDPFDQAYANFEAFYINTKEPTLDYVLTAILEPFGARIVQWDNAWWVVRIEEMADDYDYRSFDKDGDYISNSTYSPVKDLVFPTVDGDILFASKDQHMEIIPSYGLMRVVYKLGLKPNLFNNGDFRLKSTPVAPPINYILDINKDGFTLVNAGYSISEGYAIIKEDIKTVVYTLQSYILDALNSGNGGQAYLQSEALDVKMGTNNTLRINFRYKISSSYTYINFLVLQYFKVNVPYVKVRALITFSVGVDVYYLTADGRWTEEVNEVIFFIDQFDEFIESEITATQPPTGAANGDFSIRLYIPFAYYTQFISVAALKAFETIDGTDEVLPNGFRTEIRLTSGAFSDLYYYVLEETDEAEELTQFSIIEPDDYDVTNNPRKWVRRGYASSGDVSITNPKLTFTLALDRIRVNLLTDGQDPIDAVIRTANGESNNNEVFEKEVILGSYASLIVTDLNFGIDLGVFFPSSRAGISATATNILLAYLIYTGYLRDASGNGWEKWTRDGIAEEDSLHGILLKTMAAQYKASSRYMRGTFMSKGNYFGFLDVVRETNDNNRIYIPMSLSLKDKRCEYTGGMIELKNIFAAPGSDGTGEAPFTSAFSVGYGADFN